MMKFSITNQSPWLEDVYNKYFQDKKDGFLVEIGVGHTLNCSSNSSDLLDLGWRGIYIEPIKEYCNEAEIRHKDNLSRLKIINVGASNITENKTVYLGDTLLHNNLGNSWDGQQSYEWIGRSITCKNVSEILKENNCPNQFDLLSIDVEGYELKVLNGIDFYEFFPTIVVIEYNHTGIDNINNILNNNYNLIYKDTLNAAYARK